jgi:hypothetical protein
LFFIKSRKRPYYLLLILIALDSIIAQVLWASMLTRHPYVPIQEGDRSKLTI